MKKTILTSTLIVLVSAAFAQKQPKMNTFQDLIIKPSAAQLPSNNDKTVGVTLWSDNFSNASNWVIDNSGQSGIDLGWNINSTSEGWWSANGITSTSGGGNAELANGDPTAASPTQALNVVYTMTTATPIDIVALGGSNQVSIMFEQFGARFNDLQEIQISTDGVNFTTVGDNLDKSVLSQSGGAAYPNPDTKMINLATILTANPAPIYIRFSWTTNYPGSATNPNVWITYGWYIDNVKLVTNATNDISVTGSSWGTAGLPYYQIPVTQTAPIDFEIKAFNGGVNTQSNVVYNINVNAGQFTGSSVPATILSLDTTTLTVSTPYTPSAIGAYTVVSTMTADSVDDITANNAISNVAFSVTNYLYARDSGTPAGSTSNGTDGFETGNLFDIWVDQQVKAINTRLLGGGTGTVVGTEIFSKLYSVDPATGDFVFESESDPYLVTAADLNTALVMPLNTPVNMLANTTYLAVIGSFTTGLKVANAGASEPQTSFFLDMLDNTWYYQTATPIVRLNFDPVIGVNEINGVISSSVYPNPATTELTIELTTQELENASLFLLDLSGKMVRNQTATVSGTSTTTMDISSLSAGVYVLKITTDKGSITKKVVKK